MSYEVRTLGLTSEMKYSFISIYGFSAAKRAFKNRITNNISFQCIRELKIHNSGKQQNILFPYYNENYQKNLLSSFSKNQLLCHKRFSSSLSPRTRLMDLEVALTPSLFNTITQTINSFVIKNIDKEFDLQEFVKNSHTALVVVTKLISELRFSELNELLTEECIAEVESNVKEMEFSQKEFLAVKLEDIYYSFPYKSNIIKSDKYREKTYFQITVVYHIYKNYSEVSNKNPWLRLAEAKKENYYAYNCRFIREFAPNVDSQWIINGINIYRMDEQENSNLQ